MGWNWLFGLLLLAGLVLLVVVAVRALAGGVSRDGPRADGPRRDDTGRDDTGRDDTGRDDTGRDDRDEARRLLDDRYARGEISTEEYEQRRRVLGGRG